MVLRKSFSNWFSNGLKCVCGYSTYCDLASNGNIGCCDNGKICSGPVGGPSTINVPPPTQTLPPPQPGSPTAATSPAITTAASASAKVTSSNILTLPKPTITATATQAIAPIPTAAVAQIPDKSTVDSTAPVIQYQGIWTQANSSCDSTVSSMKTQDPLSYLSYRFKGTAFFVIYYHHSVKRFLIALVSVVSFRQRTSVYGFQQESRCRGVCCSVGRCTDRNRWILRYSRKQLFIHLVADKFIQGLPQPHSFLRRHIPAISGSRSVWIF